MARVTTTLYVVYDEWQQMNVLNACFVLSHQFSGLSLRDMFSCHLFPSCLHWCGPFTWNGPKIPSNFTTSSQSVGRSWCRATSLGPWLYCRSRICLLRSWSFWKRPLWRENGCSSGWTELHYVGRLVALHRRSSSLMLALITSLSHKPPVHTLQIVRSQPSSWLCHDFNPPYCLTNNYLLHCNVGDETIKRHELFLPHSSFSALRCLRVCLFLHATLLCRAMCCFLIGDYETQIYILLTGKEQ
jgi:hypothetical protein